MAQHFHLTLRFALILIGCHLGVAHGAVDPREKPLTHEITLLRTSALITPVSTIRLKAPLNETFTLSAQAGYIAKGSIIGKYDDKELRTRLETAQLRLLIARQQEAEFLAGIPKLKHEIGLSIAELEGQMSLHAAVRKDPQLADDLPKEIQASLGTTDMEVLSSQHDAAQSQLSRVSSSAFAKSSSARLQVMEAEQSVLKLEEQLSKTVVRAPIAGWFKPAASIPRKIETLLSTGQEIGLLRDINPLVAVIPATSPYLLRADLTNTVLRIEGPSGTEFTAPFHESTTTRTPLSKESRICSYEFSAKDSEALAGMVLSNVFARIILESDQPVAVINKVQAALDHPGNFKSGWSRGVSQTWPGWKLLYEGETTLGLAHLTSK